MDTCGRKALSGYSRSGVLRRGPVGILEEEVRGRTEGAAARACARALQRSGAELGRGDAGRREAGPSAAPRSHVRLLLAAHLHLLQPLSQGWRGRGGRRPWEPRPGERGRAQLGRRPPSGERFCRPALRRSRGADAGEGPCRGPRLWCWKLRARLQPLGLSSRRQGAPRAAWPRLRDSPPLPP